ncbi:MAG: ROK family protein [Lentisphaerae bacterium]|nr:ROK family protein [Lentisphaerota bacterium]
MKRSRTHAVPGLLRRLNVRRVLETVQSVGPCTRADLTRLTRISAPTMSKLVASLVREGMLERDPKPVTTRGRPGVLFRLARRRGCVHGVVIDMREVTIVAASLDGAIDPARTVVRPTPRSFDALVDLVCGEVRALGAAEKANRRGLGMTIPGLIDRRTGRVTFSPNLHFLDGRNPALAVAERLGVEVVAVQEEHALCLAAQRFGAAKGLSDFALIDVSAGFGMGVYSGGRFIEGARGYAGEIGHVMVRPEGLPCGCGNRGCLETLATDRALVEAVAAREGRAMTIDEIIGEVRAGRIQPDGLIEGVLEYLAIGVATVINIFNPEAVLMHGRMFDIEEGVLPRLIERVRRRALAPSMESCSILRTQANKPLGAVAGILNHLTSNTGPSLGAG